MKRWHRGLLLAAALPWVAPASANGQVAWGIIGGLTRAGFNGSGANDVSSRTTDVSGRTTFMLGATGDVALTETFSLRPELYFASKGAWVSTLLGDPSVGPRKRFTLPYIEAPLLVQMRTAGGPDSIRPHLFGGVSVGALLRCRLEGQDCGEIDGINHRRIDMGVLVGGELEWRGAAIGVRYEAGARAMEASIPGNEIYNGVLSFTVRYRVGDSGRKPGPNGGAGR